MQQNLPGLSCALLALWELCLSDGASAKAAACICAHVQCTLVLLVHPWPPNTCLQGSTTRLQQFVV